MAIASGSARDTPSRTKLARLRKAAGHEQQAFAGQIGVSRSTLQRYEAGDIANPALPVLVNAAIALRVPLGEVIEDHWLTWWDRGSSPRKNTVT